MNEAAIVVCPHCHTPNRVPAERLRAGDARGTCGRCKQSLHVADPVALDAAGFQALTGRSGIPVVVDFWAPWCGPCRMMAPAFAEAARRTGPGVQFAKLNTEEHPEIAARYGIRSIPTLAIFQNGQEIARQSGAMDAATLLRWLATHRA